MYGMSTPTRGPVNRFNIHNVWGPPLSLANKKLMANPHPRDYSIPSYRDPTPSTPPTPKTQCYPHPLYPLEYWRAWADAKRGGYIHLMRSESGKTDVDDRRSSIDDVYYWKCETKFWMSKSRFKEGRRRKISEANYWRCEADFWRTACAANENQASRESIQDAEYWKCESRFWKSTCPRAHEDTRYDGIDDPNYWECENRLYENLLRVLTNADEPGYHQALLRERGYDYDYDSPNQSPKTPPRRSARLINLKQKAAVNSSTSRSELHASTNASSTKKRKIEDQATNNNHRKRKFAR